MMKSTKHLLSALALMMAMVFSASTADAQNLSSLEGKARGALNNCLAPYNGNQIYEVEFAVAVVDCFTAPCPVQYIVTVFVGPNCQPDDVICPAFPSFIVGQVEFDGNGQIVGVTSICD